MEQQKKNTVATRPSLHPRNKHKGRYNLKALCQAHKALKPFVAKNKYGNLSIDFFNPAAVKALNKAILMMDYEIAYWDIPDGFLCPPIPGRADYVHHMADVLASVNGGHIPYGAHIQCLDIGVGANCIYPIIGNSSYQWSFMGSDIDPKALTIAQDIIDNNTGLANKVTLRRQHLPAHSFTGIVTSIDKIDLTVCNPPFHATKAEAEAGSLRKLSNLKKKRIKKPQLNFSGNGGELWTDGGEKRFVLNLITESALFSKNCAWFSTLVSKQANLAAVYKQLEKIGVESHRTIAMGQGNKRSRLVAWTFLPETALHQWAQERWRQV